MSTPSHRRILQLALPVMVANVSTPLLGVVDTAVVGRLPGPEPVGAVAMGSLIFSFVYWAFGFLRMGTTGLTAQALGAGDDDEVQDALGRALFIGAVAGFALFFAGPLIRWIALGALQGSESVETLAASYIDVRVRSAPATFANYALLGWFIGLGKTRTALLLQLVLNVSNMLLDALFVLVLDEGVAGVALGTVIAEWIAVVVGLALILRHLGGLPHFTAARIFSATRMRKTLAINRDIMLRSIALVGVFLFFMAEGARMGDRMLAANAVLMHFIDTSAYFLDGLAFAAEALVGKAVGARDRSGVRSASLQTSIWAGAIALCASILLALFHGPIIDAITSDPITRQSARSYALWAAAGPIVGVWCFQLDGIFIGATRGTAMRNAMLVSTAVFFVAWWLLRPYANHGLWLAFHIFYLARFITLALAYPALEAGVVEGEAPQRSV